MFNNCKNKYEACDRAFTFIFGQEYLDSLSEDDYLILVRRVKFLFESGMRWQEKQMFKDAIEGTVLEPESLWWYIKSDDLEGEFLVKNNLQDGDRVKLIVIKDS